MKRIQLGQTPLTVPQVAVGCMRIEKLDAKAAAHYVAKAVDLGIDFFDNADIYGGGRCEEILGTALRDAGIARENVLLQSKVAINKGTYDFSKEYILQAAEGCLKRLGTDYLDTLLLHRPDALMEPEEVAEAFYRLKTAGKVRFFGVSNQNPYQMELLSSVLPEPLCANQLQLSIAHAGMIANGIHVNTMFDNAIDRDGGVLDYCRLKKITIQPWSPFQYGFFEGVFIGSDKYPELNAKLKELAEKYGVTPTTVAVMWLTRHPAKFMPIVGTMNEQRLSECAAATDFELTRREWYEIYLAAGNILP